MQYQLRALSEEAFRPYGEVFTPPPVGQRTLLAAAFQNLRSHAALECYINHREPTVLPHKVRTMEQHPFSSQIFVPLNVSRYVIGVAPRDSDGRPNLSRGEAFLARHDQAVNYRAGVWHAPLIVLDQRAQFIVVMWKDGSTDDECFIDLPHPVQFVE